MIRGRKLSYWFCIWVRCCGFWEVFKFLLGLVLYSDFRVILCFVSWSVFEFFVIKVFFECFCFRRVVVSVW